jgi:hypothetical protein
VSRHSSGISPRLTFVRASWPSDISLQISKLSFLSRAGKAVGCRCTLYVLPARPCVGLRSSFCSIINVNSAINSTNQLELITVTDCLAVRCQLLQEMEPWLRWLVRRRGGTGSIPSQGLWCTKFNCDRFLVAFTKLRKANVSFVMSARLSVRTEQLGSHWTDFR